MSSDAPRHSGPKPGAESRRVLYVALTGDLLIAGSKFFAAAMTGSSAMLAEGVHSVVDIGNELLLLQGFRRGHRANDEWHPFGYGKATYIWSLLVALSVFSVGGGVSLYEGIIGLVHARALSDPTWNYVVLGVAAVFEGMSWRVSTRALSRDRGASESLWHVGQRNMDVLVFTVFVEDSAALIGIAIAAIGIGLGHALGNPYLDPIASVLIGFVLIAAAALLARKSVGLLVGESIDGEHLSELRKIITADPAVETLGHLQTMRLGPESVLLTAAIRFGRRLDPDHVEQAIDRIERAIRSRYPTIQHLYLESGLLKDVSRTTREQSARDS